MSSSKDISNEDLRKLEDEAYYELCQIIAEAMQLQDIELLDYRIASWKTKYKKLLDRPSTSSKSDFKKRIEFLLTQYYSQVTQYILTRLKLQEEKKIENQSKALRELYRIIKDTNDYDLLKKKIEKWKEKYPVSEFLAMYQKRIESYTRDKNLKENAFEQDKAFKELVDITKKNATIDEFKEFISDWEKEYSINNKFTIDDFIKHQSEVKRYTSDEYLISIARDEPNFDDVNKILNNNGSSNLALQDNAYKSLINIVHGNNNINEVFDWVYQNRYIRFNDRYKELILSATYLEYRPAYLNQLSRPNLDMSDKYLSFNEYKNMDDIKRYVVISYFNLLLPPSKTVTNDYFNKYIYKIYDKSEKARVSNDTNFMSELMDSGIEISLKIPDKNTSQSIATGEENLNSTTSEKDNERTLDTVYKIPAEESFDKEKASIDLSGAIEILNSSQESKINPKEEFVEEQINTNSKIEIHSEKQKDISSEFISNSTTLSNNNIENNANIEESKSTSKEDVSNSVSEPFTDYNTITIFAPYFFEKIQHFDRQTAIYNSDKQNALINLIDSQVTEYIKPEQDKTLEQNLEKNDIY